MMSNSRLSKAAHADKCFGEGGEEGQTTVAGEAWFAICNNTKPRVTKHGGKRPRFSILEY